MKRYRVPVEKYQYYGVYVYANSEDEAAKIVGEMIDNENIEYDDEGDGDTRVVDSEIYEINENGNMKLTRMEMRFINRGY